MNLNELPHEILITIFSLLNPYECCRAAEVCKYWMKEASDSYLWFLYCKRYFKYNNLKAHERESKDIRWKDVFMNLDKFPMWVDAMSPIKLNPEDASVATFLPSSYDTSSLLPIRGYHTVLSNQIFDVMHSPLPYDNSENSISSKGVLSWKIKVAEQLIGWLIIFGIVSEHHPGHEAIGNVPHSYGYLFKGSIQCGGPARKNPQLMKLPYVYAGDVVTIAVDTRQQTLAFSVNGSTPVIAVSNLSPQVRYRVAVSLDYPETSVQLLSQQVKPTPVAHESPQTKVAV